MSPVVTELFPGQIVMLPGYSPGPPIELSACKFHVMQPAPDVIIRCAVYSVYKGLPSELLIDFGKFCCDEAGWKRSDVVLGASTVNGPYMAAIVASGRVIVEGAMLSDGVIVPRVEILLGYNPTDEEVKP